MPQTDIIFEVTNLFSEKFKDLAEVKIKDSFEETKKEGEPIIYITLIGVEELFNQNLNRNIQQRRTEEDGSQVEYFVKPATEFKLTYMVTPYFKTYADSLKTLGIIVQLLKDNFFIQLDKEYDWVENHNNPVKVTPMTGMNIEKQMHLWSILKAEYWPSLFYQLIVGIDSGKIEGFRRVKERKISTVVIKNNEGKDDKKKDSEAAPAE